MMLFKLSMRNIKKSMRDYVIYFATLILGVAIFYVFNAINEQSAMMVISNDTREVIQYLVDVMPVVSVFVATVLGFLVVYANTFLMKRRKKEFGIYMLLGMGKMKISAILVIETIMIGLISLAVGLVFGVLASQGMSIAIANMFEADVTAFQFTVSMEAIQKTFIYFIIMYVIVIVSDVFVVGKSKLITLLHAAKKSQKNFGKNPILCLVVFVIAAVLLGTAYYKVTAGMQTIQQFSQLAVEVGKGIVGTFLLFWSLSGLILFLVKGNKNFYFKGLNAFSTKELSSRVNTTVFSGSVICLLLFFCICTLASAVSIKKSLDENLRELVPMDVQFELWDYGFFEEDERNKSLTDRLVKAGVPVDELTDFVEITTCYRDDVCVKFEYDGSISYDNWIEFTTVSEYNRLANMFGRETITLDEGMYVIVANYSEIIPFLEKSLKARTTYTLNGKEYRPLYTKCIDGFIELSNTQSNGGVIVFSDDLDMTKIEHGASKTYLFANYVNQDKKARREMDQRIKDADLTFPISEEAVQNGAYYNISYEEDGKKEYYCSIDFLMKNYIYDTSVGMSALVVFVGSYIGVIFLISSGAILALKELSEAADNKEKYQMLRKIGVDERMISRSLLTQCGVFFGIPLFVAIIHSIFGMKTASFILYIFGKSGFFVSMLIAGCIILAIYGAYFVITYACCRKIISE